MTAAASEPPASTPLGALVGLTVTHRRYVSHGHAHYGGELVDGAYLLGMFGDVATELCVRSDGDEGLLAGYQRVAFHAPVRAGDVLEAIATLTRIGRRSRELEFRALVSCRASPERGPSAALVLPEPLLVASAHGVVVLPAWAT